MFCKCNVVILGSLSRLPNHRGVYPKVTQTQSKSICGNPNWQHVGESSIEVNKDIGSKTLQSFSIEISLLFAHDFGTKSYLRSLRSLL